MLQTNAPVILNRLCVRTSCVAMLKLELSTEHRRRLFRELEEYKWFRGLGSSIRPSSDLSMQQTSAPDDSESVSVSTS
eukprot:1280700-Pyramimonas_sp.AAC.1